MDILKELLTFISKKEITEARDPNLTYTEKEVKKQIDRVTVVLDGVQSGKFTRLAKRYRNVQKALDILDAKMKDLNEEIKEKALDLFDAEDEIYTRVVETVSLTMTVSKRQVSTKTDINYEKAVDQLLEMVPDLENQIKELIEANKQVKTVEKSPALRTALKESFMSDAFRQVKQIAKQALTSIKSWGKAYDKKLKELEKLLD
jgi:hypothetical protein